MKKFLYSFYFSFRFAFKNIFYYKFKSILLLLSFIALLSALLMSFSSRSYISSYFISNYENRYQDLDIKMSISPNSNSRFFSMRDLNDALDKDQYFDEIIPFFEIDSLVEINSSKEYMKVMSSSLSNLKKVSNINYQSENLLSDEVIITKSISINYSLNLEDEIILHVGESNKIYKVVSIVEDSGLFQGETIF
jgi:hypothetical protein